MTDCTIFDQGLNFYDHRSLSGYRVPEVFGIAILEAPGLKVLMIDITIANEAWTPKIYMVDYRAIKSFKVTCKTTSKL